MSFYPAHRTSHDCISDAMLCRLRSRRRKPSLAAVEQAATKFLSHAGQNISRKSRKPAQLKAFSFTDYQLIAKLISVMDNI